MPSIMSKEGLAKDDLGNYIVVLTYFKYYDCAECYSDKKGFEPL